MLKNILCVNCKETVKANPRLKGEQKYCGKSECQRERKRKWYQKKINSDPDYSLRQKECKRKWRKNKPCHVYQKNYRESHGEYVKKNRRQQRKRNRDRHYSEKQNELKKIVKIDALPAKVDKTKTYEMRILSPNMSKKIVKIDTMIVELQEYKRVSAMIS